MLKKFLLTTLGFGSGLLMVMGQSACSTPATPVTANSPPAMGGWQLADVKDERVLAAAQFAITAHAAGPHQPQMLDAVLRAESQIVAGTNYRLRLQFIDKSGQMKIANAVVWAKLDRSHVLTQWTLE